MFQRGPTARDDMLLGLALLNFVGGYAVNLALGAMSLRGTRHKGLWPHVIFIPVYWLFVSAAAYRAVWQLVRAPFYWEKTEHGVSSQLKPIRVMPPGAALPFSNATTHASSCRRAEAAASLADCRFAK